MANSIFEMLVEQQNAWIAEQRRIVSSLLALPTLVQVARETRVGTTPHDVVFERGTLRILRYRREAPALYSEPVLFCYALINRPYILDLQPDKSVVRQYLEHGFEVYMIDWGVPSDADHGLTLEDYVCRFLKDAVELILADRGCERLHLLGYCMGGTMSAMFAALHPECVKSLTLLASPIDFGGRESLLSLWADRECFDVDAFIDANGNCPASFLQACFLYVKPIQNLLEKRISLCEHMDDPRFLSNYFAVENWVNDNIPVAGETFRVFIKRLYQNNELIRGEFHLGGQRVDLGQLKCPLLLLTAKNDHLVPPASTDGIRSHVGSDDILSVMIDAGHVGLVVSGKAQKTFWPEATHWLANRSTPVVPASPVVCGPLEPCP